MYIYLSPSLYIIYLYSLSPFRPLPVPFPLPFPLSLQVDPRATHCLLRPETVESIFILYRYTKDPIYREWGWSIFKSLVHNGRVPGGGYSGIRDVRKHPPKTIDEAKKNWNDKMESFFLAETLKYLYLLFNNDDVIPLDKWVFNTEAHPLPIAP